MRTNVVPSSTSSWIAPDLQAVIDTLTDLQILALTLFGEARSEPIEGIVAVGCVIRNRVNSDLSRRSAAVSLRAKGDWWGERYRGVCLAPYQFSMWHRFPGKDGVDRNYDKVVAMATRLAREESGGSAIDECAWVAEGIYRNALRDRVKGSTHYHTVTLRPRPAWAQRKVPRLQVGNHVFYGGIT